MKILFIYKFEFVEPLGLMYLFTFLKKYGHDCYFIDIGLEKDLIPQVKKISPDMVAYSITTGNHQFYQKLNKRLKRNFKFFSVFGGPHCTFYPQFIYEEGIDVIFRGESEVALLELVNSFEKNKKITNIKNIWIKLGNKVYKNEVRPFVKDLDKLPFIERGLVGRYQQYKNMKRRFVLTGRGCSFNCSYCFNRAYNRLYENKGDILRKRNIKNVIEELRYIKKNYAPQKIWFVDDNLIFNKKWIMDFCKLYRREIKLPFIVYVRVDQIDKGIVKALKYSGCITVQFGIENGNEKIRREILRRHISNEQIVNASKLFNMYNIKIHSQNMIGLPNETLDSAFNTLKLNIKCNCAYSWASILQPYPCTDLYEFTKEGGYFNGDLNLIGNNYYQKSVLKIK